MNLLSGFRQEEAGYELIFLISLFKDSGNALWNTKNFVQPTLGGLTNQFRNQKCPMNVSNV